MHSLERTLAIVFTAVGASCLFFAFFLFSLDPSDSNNIQEHPIITLCLIFAIIGFIFFSAGLFIIVRYVIRRRKLRTLLLKGQKIRVPSEAISVRKMNYSNAVYFVISLEWRDNDGQLPTMFTSKEVPFNPEEFLSDRDIMVYVNRNNPQDYYVDVSFLPKLAKW